MALLVRAVCDRSKNENAKLKSHTKRSTQRNFPKTKKQTQMHGTKYNELQNNMSLTGWKLCTVATIKIIQKHIFSRYFSLFRSILFVYTLVILISLVGWILSVLSLYIFFCWPTELYGIMQFERWKQTNAHTHTHAQHEKVS